MIANSVNDQILLLLGTGVSASKDITGLLQTVQSALDNGILGFDTAPSYKSEKNLAECLLSEIKSRNIPRKKLFIQDKVDAWQMLKSKEEIYSISLNTLKNMQLDYLDAYLIHWPVPEYFEKTWEVLMKLKREGYVRYIGSCNFRMRQLDNYKAAGYEFDIIQIERHPLRTCIDEEMFCRKNDITLQAYSPLCKMDERILENESLKNISGKYQKDIGQVILRWHLDTGYIPIFASQKPIRIKHYTEIFDFSLSEVDIDVINQMNIDHKMYLESFACPGF